jgi:hypothetical protein
MYLSPDKAAPLNTNTGVQLAIPRLACRLSWKCPVGRIQGLTAATGPRQWTINGPRQCVFYHQFFQPAPEPFNNKSYCPLGFFRNLVDGQIVGEHSGVHKWTIGQRIRLGGQPEALFVVKRLTETNDILVAPGEAALCRIVIFWRFRNG